MPVLMLASAKALKAVDVYKRQAEYGAEIFKLSAEMGTPIYFEASAGGGIPIIQSLQNSLICNHINSIVGIINGTSNYRCV